MSSSGSATRSTHWTADWRSCRRPSSTRRSAKRGVILPGYTHLQRAQPVLAAHYFLAYVEKFQRDRERLADCRKRVNVLPLGAAALAGTSLPIDREIGATKLGFDSVARNSLDVSSDRDFLLEFVFCLSLIATHLSGWAEEWVIWSTTEFNFLDLPDAFCTGSSIMPHKKNPDVLELTRGKSARVDRGPAAATRAGEGAAARLQPRLAGRQDRPFRCLRHGRRSLGVAAPLVRQTKLRREVIASRLEDGFLDATTLMEAFDRARGADADRPRSGRHAGPNLRTKAVPTRRPAERVIRSLLPRHRPETERHAGCRQRSKGVPGHRLHRPGGSRETIKVLATESW